MFNINSNFYNIAYLFLIIIKLIHKVLLSQNHQPYKNQTKYTYNKVKLLEDYYLQYNLVFFVLKFQKL